MAKPFGVANFDLTENSTQPHLMIGVEIEYQFELKQIFFSSLI